VMIGRSAEAVAGTTSRDVQIRVRHRDCGATDLTRGRKGCGHRRRDPQAPSAAGGVVAVTNGQLAAALVKEARGDRGRLANTPRLDRLARPEVEQASEEIGAADFENAWRPEIGTLVMTDMSAGRRRNLR